MEGKRPVEQVLEELRKVQKQIIELEDSNYPIDYSYYDANITEKYSFLMILLCNVGSGSESIKTVLELNSAGSDNTKSFDGFLELMNQLSKEVQSKKDIRISLNSLKEQQAELKSELGIY